MGRIDLFLVYAFDLVALFATVLNVQLSVHCMALAFNRNFRILYSLCINAVLVVISFIFNNKYVLLQKTIGGWLWIPALLFAYFIPVLAWALRRKNK